MSESAGVTDTGDRVELSQIGRETLLITPSMIPNLIITPADGEQITLENSIHNLILSETTAETLVIHDAGRDTVVISQETGAGSVYGRPYTQADDGQFYYFAWQHTNGTQWKAQRFELETLALLTAAGDNPQPDDLDAFEALFW